MNRVATLDADQAPLPFSAIPRMPLGRAMRAAFSDRDSRRDVLSVQRRLYEEYGPVVHQWAGPLTFVNLFGPDANRLVLLDRRRRFSARRSWMKILGEIFPDGLMLLDGDEHRHHRKILHEAFRKPALAAYAERMHPMIERGMAGWGSGPRRAFPSFEELTLDMAASNFLGAELGAGTRRLNDAFEDMVSASLARFRLRLPGTEFRRGLDGRKVMLAYLRNMLRERRARETSDMMSRLCRATTPEGERFSDQQVVDHMLFMMLAAHGTSTSTLTSMTYELGRHPEWQERVRDESLALDKERPEPADLDRLEALTLVMRETLRRYPPLPMLPRTALEDFEFGGYRFPAGKKVLVSVIFTHHMEAWWSDPFTFDPERFAPGRAEHERHSHSYLPFGSGPHTCLGMRFAEMQIRMIFHHLVSRYRWSLPEGYRMPIQQAPISKPLDGLPVEFRPL